MDNKQTVPTSTAVRFAPAALLPLVLYAGSSQAAVDVSAATTEISGLAAPVAAVGGAILLILVGIKAWKMIRGAM